MNETLGLTILVLAAIASMVAVRRTRIWFNPVFLIAVSFFLPMAVATFHLSGLQRSEWTLRTWGLLFEAAAIWLIVPSAVLATGARLQGAGPVELPSRGGWVTWGVRVLGVLVVVSTLLQNRILGGSWVLLFDPDAAYELHTKTVPGLQIFGRSAFAAAAGLFLLLSQRRSWLDATLLLCVFLVPLTRLARFDLMMSGLTLVALNARYPVVRIRGRTVVGGIIVFAGLAYGAVVLGNLRTSKFGALSTSYARAIDFQGPPGPGESFSVVYGYFGLSFENLDRFVRADRGHRTYGLLSLSPVFNTVFFVGRLTQGEYPGPAEVVRHRNPVGTMATVGTALSDFYLDFGMLAFLPMLGYGMVWVILYYLSRRGPVLYVIYCSYTAAICLSSFQAVVVAPFLYQGILLGLVPFGMQRVRDQLGQGRLEQRPIAQL